MKSKEIKEIARRLLVIMVFIALGLHIPERAAQTNPGLAGTQ